MRRIDAGHAGSGGPPGGARGLGSRAGFSLVEVLVALSIVTVGVTAVLALFARGVDVHKQAVDQTNVALAAQSIAAEIEAGYTVAAIDAWKRKRVRAGKKAHASDYLKDIGVKRPVEVPGFPNYRYSVRFTPLDEAGFAVLAEIKVYWRKGGGLAVPELVPKVILKRPY